MSKRVVFIGSSEWGLRSLRVLTELDDIEVVGAVTNPAVFKISYSPDGVRNVHHADVPSFCEENDISTYLMGSDEPMKSPRLMEVLEAWAPDYFFALGWYHVIPAPIRELAPVLGIHYSLLPDYSGGAPLVWAMINQEQIVGATLFQLDGGIDTGPIIGQAHAVVHPRETIKRLYDRVGEISLELLRFELPRFVREELSSTVQASEGRRVFPQRSPEDGLIDWSHSAAQIDAFIRAQSRPYPGAFTRLNEQLTQIWRATPFIESNDGPTGSIFSDNDQVFIRCASGIIRLDEVEIAGRVYQAEHVVDAVMGERAQRRA